MLETIKTILLAHQGKQNAIASAEIAKAIGIVENDTHAQTRALILECAEQYRLPVAASANGYYLITSQQELDEYMANLDLRIEGMEERKRLIHKNYKENQ